MFDGQSAVSSSNVCCSPPPTCEGADRHVHRSHLRHGLITTIECHSAYILGAIVGGMNVDLSSDK